MKKKIISGAVAIIYSGSEQGWYTEHGIEELLFDPEVVDFISQPYNPDIVLDYCQRKYGVDHNYSAIPYLRIEWISKGNQFYVHPTESGEIIFPLKEIRELCVQA